MNIAHDGYIPGRFAHFNLPESEWVAAGRRALESAACRRCHVWDRRGNRLAADLDQSSRRMEPSAMLAAIREPAAFMPDFPFSEDRTTALINALLAAGSAAPLLSGEHPRVIYFDARRSDEKNPFVEHCGGCHRTVTDRHGGLGRGDDAPHLAGLLTEFYPRTFKGDEPWTREALKKWLENPRQSRPSALMAPVRLSDEAFDALLSVIHPAQKGGEEGDR